MRRTWRIRLDAKITPSGSTAAPPACRAVATHVLLVLNAW
jgi:hypothetical protein